MASNKPIGDVSRQGIDGACINTLPTSPLHNPTVIQVKGHCIRQPHPLFRSPSQFKFAAIYASRPYVRFRTLNLDCEESSSNTEAAQFRREGTEREDVHASKWFLKYTRLGDRRGSTPATSEPQSQVRIANEPRDDHCRRWHDGTGQGFPKCGLHVTANLRSPGTTMSLEAARNLSIQDLLRVLDERFGQECARLRKYRLPPIVSTTSLEPHVSSTSSSWQLILNGCGVGVLC